MSFPAAKTLSRRCAKQVFREFILAVIAVLGIGVSMPVLAQHATQEGAKSTPKPITIGQVRMMHSKILDQDRVLLIHLPKGYALSNQSYPVIYVLDGRTQFEHVASLADFLSSSLPPEIPRMIVVGIVQKNRNHELMPAAKTATNRMPLAALGKSLTIRMRDTGGTDGFYRFLTQEVSAYMRKHFRVALFRILAGHSAGGLFVIHTMLKHPRSFNAYIAMSPSLFWDDGHEVSVARKTLGSLPLQHRFLFLGAGAYEGIIIENMNGLRSILALRHPRGLRWWYKIVPKTYHQDSPYEQMYFAMQAIFSNWRVPQSMLMTGDMKGLERHYAQASRIYAYKFKPSEWLVNQTGYLQLGLLKSPKVAERVFRTNVKLYPKSGNASDSLADALVAQGKLPEAIAQEKRAITLARAQHDPRLQYYVKKLGRLQHAKATDSQ